MSFSFWPRCVAAFFVSSLAFVICAPMRPQQSIGDSVLRITTRVVNINVVVTDRQGNPVKGLTKDDFTVLDAGQAQKISFFTAVNNEQPFAAAVPSGVRPDPNTYTNTLVNGGADPSVTILLFDTLNSRWTSQGYALNCLRKLVRQLDPQDHIGIYVLGEDLTVVHEFSRDATDLAAAIRRYDERHSPDATKLPPSEQSAEDARLDRFLAGKDNHGNVWMDEMNKTQAYQQAHQAIAVETTTAWLEVIARQLSGIPGRKTLIWVTDGIGQLVLFDRNDFDEYLAGWRKNAGVTFSGSPLFKNGDDVEGMIRLMNNAGIAVYPVDSRGLEAVDLGFRNTPGSAPPVSSPTGPVEELLGRLPHPDSDALEIASRTGGRAFYNRNDLETGIRRALNDSRFTYELAYHPDHDRWKGEWRKIQVKVNRPDVTVLAREGYFAMPDPRPLPPKSRIEFLSQIAASPLDAAELPLSVQIASLTGAMGRELTAKVHMNPQSMLTVQENGHWKGNFEVMFMQLSAKSKLLDAAQKKVDADLDSKEYAEIVRNGWDLPVQLKLVPGATVLCVILHDKSSNAAGSVRIPLAAYTAAGAH
jgi:VWFA-related protein